MPIPKTLWYSPKITLVVLHQTAIRSAWTTLCMPMVLLWFDRTDKIEFKTLHLRTMTFRKNILATYSSQIVSVSCSFLSTILATRMLGDSGQGELALYVNYILLSALLIGFGLPAGIVHFVASGKLEKQKLFSLIVLILSLGLGLIVLSMAVLYSFSLLHVLLPDSIHRSVGWVGILLIHLVFIVLNSFLAAILQAESRFRFAGFTTIIGSSSILVLYAAKYYFMLFPAIPALQWVILSMLAGNGLQSIIYLKKIHSIQPSYFSFDRIQGDVIKPLMQFAFLAFSTNFIQFLSYRMDIWIVNYYHGKQMTGIYSLSVSLAQMVWLLPAAVQSVLYAFISTHDDRRLNVEKTVKTTWQIGIYAVSAGLLGYVSSVYLVPVLFGEAFSESVRCIGILLFGVVPFCLSMAISGYFAGTGRVQVNLQSAVLGFLACLVADLLLIPTFGISGAAFASVISYLTTVVYLLLKFRNE